MLQPLNKYVDFRGNNMNYYLIDYENIHSDGLKELKDIKDGDSLIMFYSDQCKNISLDVLQDVFSKRITCHIFKASVGTKNALDFQLASYLGYLIGENSQTDTNYYIISNDTGYDCLCNFWKKEKKKAKVSRISTQVEAPATVAKEKASKKPASNTKKKASKVKAADKATLDEIKKILSDVDLPEKSLEEILDIFNQYKTKQSISNGLAKLFRDSRTSGSIYKKLKPLLKEKNKS